MNYESTAERISARRKRIRNRLDAAKKIKTMIQVKNVLGYTDTTGGDTYAVEVENSIVFFCTDQKYFSMDRK